MQQAFTSQNLNLSCHKNNLAQMFCATENCFRCALVCRQEFCSCLPAEHRDCDFVYVQSFLQRIVSKRKQMNEKVQAAANAIQLVYEQTIDRLSRDRQNFLQWRQNYGLNQDQIELMQLLVSTKGRRVTGDNVYKVKTRINQKINTFITENTIDRFWKRQKKQFAKIFNTFNDLYGSNNIKINSTIINNTQKIRQFLQEPISELKLLYRASQHKFLVSQFHKACDNIPETLIMAKTEYDKIIGGYTPFPWKSTENLESTQDPEKKSFIFSLTLEEKYPLVGYKHALGHHTSCGPCFGRFGNDIGIADMSNSSDKSLCDFPNQYNNGKYQKSQAITQAFCGAPKGNKVKFTQWEVYQVKWLGEQIIDDQGQK